MSGAFEDAGGGGERGAKQAGGQSPGREQPFGAVREAGDGIGDDDGAEAGCEGGEVVAGIAGEDDFFRSEIGMGGEPLQGGGL